MSAATDSFVQNNQDRFLEELKSFLRIPSISTLPEHRGDIDLRTAPALDRDSSGPIHQLKAHILSRRERARKSPLRRHIRHKKGKEKNYAQEDRSFR